MARLRVVCSYALAVLALLPAVASAQSANTGAIAGVVRDSTGAVLPGVTVEAASPALIEKVRSAVTDGSGNYKVVDLRPGTYTVTFSLTGFSTVKREGIELSTGVTANINGDLKVGSLEETVTVSGANPVVDIQNVRSQTVLSNALLEALPSSKLIGSLAVLTVGVVAATNDTSGARGDVNNALTIHGGRGDDSRNKIDGMSLQNNSGNGGGQNFVYRPNSIAMQETTIETGGMTAESETGGVQLNYVPREGGNQFSFAGLADFTNNQLQNKNITDEIRARGLTTVPGVKKIYDYGLGFGGPVKHDKAWFYTAHRFWGADQYAPGAYFNKDVKALFYVPDLSQPAYTHVYDRDHSGRMTWQISSKHKVNISESYQDNCICWIAITSASAPENVSLLHFTPLSMTQVTWSNPRTNRLLFDAGYSYVYNGKKTPLGEGVTNDDGSIGIVDQGLAISYRSMTNFPNTTTYSQNGQLGNQFNTRAAMAYVTGSHAFKAGVLFYGGREHVDRFIIGSMSYTFNNRVPVSLTEYSSPLLGDLHTNNTGIYAQDQWTINRLTLSGGVRFDVFTGTALATDLPASRFLPARQLAELKNVPNWKDASPRVGGAFDVFGTGKTAIKGYVGKFMQSMGIGFTDRNSPAGSLTISSTRNWNDSTFPAGDPRRGNFVPDCDLKNVTANGECGALNNSLFGTLNRTRIDSPEVSEGWGARGYTWSESIALQQELRPGMALNVGYFRTTYGNITVIDNLLRTPADFDSYCVITPADSRLPGGGNQRLCGLANISRAKATTVNEEVRLSQGYGDGNSEVFNGVDVGINSRFGAGGQLNGGLSLGRSIVNNCATVDSPQDAREGFCITEPTWGSTARYTASVVYPLPLGVQISANYQNTPGVAILANRTFTNAEIAPALGRNLSACPANTGTCTQTVTIAMIPTDADTTFEKRQQQLDLRLTKRIKVAKTRLQAHIDIYNLFNSTGIVSRNNTYTPPGAVTANPWGRPTAIQGARLFKVGGNFDF